MNTIVPLTETLFRMAVLEERDAAAARSAGRPGWASVSVNEFAFALVGRGHVLAAAGLVPVWHGLACAWMLVSRDATARDLVPALREARAVLDARQREPAFRRIEFHVCADMPWHESFAAALGMTERAGPLTAWDELGRDFYLYGRVAAPAAARQALAA